MQEAGADAVLETAFTLADGLEYCRSGMYMLLHIQLGYMSQILVLVWAAAWVISWA